VKPIAAMGISVRELLRVNTAPYGELGLDNPDFTARSLLTRYFCIQS